MLFWKTFFEILVWGFLNVKKIKIGVVGILWKVLTSPPRKAEKSQDGAEKSQDGAEKSQDGADEEMFENIWKIYEK